MMPFVCVGAVVKTTFAVEPRTPPLTAWTSSVPPIVVPTPVRASDENVRVLLPPAGSTVSEPAPALTVSTPSVPLPDTRAIVPPLRPMPRLVLTRLVTDPAVLFNSSVPPVNAVTVPLVPVSAPLPWSCRVPARTSTAPVNALDAVSRAVPVPTFTSLLSWLVPVPRVPVNAPLKTTALAPLAASVSPLAVVPVPMSIAPLNVDVPEVKSGAPPTV